MSAEVVSKKQRSRGLRMTTYWIILDPLCWVSISTNVRSPNPPPPPSPSKASKVQWSSLTSLKSMHGTTSTREMETEVIDWNRVKGTRTYFSPIDAFIGQHLLPYNFKTMLLFVAWLLDTSEGNNDGSVWSCSHTDAGFARDVIWTSYQHDC